MSLRVASFKLVSSRWNPSHFTWNAAAENLENLVALVYSMTWGPQGSEDPRVDMSWVRNRFPAFSHFPARGPRAVENEHQFALILEKMDEEEEQQEEGLDQNEEPKPKVQNPLDLRYGYAVSVIAGVNVDLTPLRESIVGIPGIGILTKSDVIEAMDEPVLAEKVQKILSEEGAEVDPTTFSELLRVVLNRDAPDPPEELTQEPDDPISALLSIPRGPRREQSTRQQRFACRDRELGGAIPRRGGTAPGGEAARDCRRRAPRRALRGPEGHGRGGA